MTSSAEPSSRRGWVSDPVVLGTGFCVLSALCYTATNICLRQLAEIEVDPAWVICIKESVTVALVGPWLVLQILRGVRFSISAKALAVLLLVGLAAQLGGNLSVQWAFGVVGLVVTMPLIFGVMLIGSALIGFFVLDESLTNRSIVAVGLLIVSIVLLSFGAEGADSSPETSPTASSASLVLLGIAAACLGGAMFACLGAAVRFAAKQHVPVAVTVFTVTAMGVLSLGVTSLVRLGPDRMLATGSYALVWMLAAGLFNLMAFLAITKGLQLTTLVHANLLNASQVGLGATAGIILFQEPRNVWLITGIALTILGILFVGRPPADEEQVMESV